MEGGTKMEYLLLTVIDYCYKFSRPFWLKPSEFEMLSVIVTGADKNLISTENNNILNS